MPAADPLASPPPLIDATLESDELHVTELLMSFVLPSERCAVATNCCVLPMPIDMDDGEIARDETVAVELFEPDDCELPPDAPPPQPQLSAPSNNTAINENFFMTFSRFAIRDARAHPDRFIVRSRRRPQSELPSWDLVSSAVKKVFWHSKPGAGSSPQTTVLTYISMQSESRSRRRRKDDHSMGEKSATHLFHATC